MSTGKSIWMALVPVLVAVLAAAAPAQQARLATYEKDGQTYFALSLMSGLKADPAQTSEIVVLVDTSASQAGAVRADALAALGSLLAGLKSDDRVHLMAVDLNAVAMHEGFVAPGSAGMQAALAKLQGRAPLGATDLDDGLRAAAARFTASGAARNVVYIGDAMTKANLFTTESLGELVNELRSQKVSVSGYVVGLERNGQLMAALANHTGGMAVIDGPAGRNPAAAGQSLAAAMHQSVIWPTAVTKSDNVAAAYPTQMPPLRTDRDSILVGTLSSIAEVSVEVSGIMNGREVTAQWQATPDRPSEDFAFLPRLVEMAASDAGLSLPTVGSSGLREAAVATLASAHELTKLGQQALATGNLAGAKAVADAALARDPSNPEARAIKQAAGRVAAAGGARAGGEPDLKLTGFAAADKPAGGLLEEVLAEEPGFLGRVEGERQVMTGKFRAEVEYALSEARKIMGQDPQIAEQNLKVVLHNIESQPELPAELRGLLRQQVENAIRQARQQAVEVAVRMAAVQQRIAEGKEMERIAVALETQHLRLKQLMDRFESLLDEGRYQIADDEVAPEVQRLAPGTSLASQVIEGGRMMRMHDANAAVWQAKDKNFLLALYQVELSQVPFPDEPPIIYMPADQWQDLTLRREKYKAVALDKQGGAEERIFKELNNTTELSFVETPLKDVVVFLHDRHRIPIELNLKALTDAGVDPDSPVTKDLGNITLRSALRLTLNEFDLTYVVRDEVLMITTHEDAEGQLITKVYPVGDLVVPVGVSSNLFGLGGGGMMGGMGGGMGGGMMGGGMGGGGMMGGGMGGGGGGFFAVEDDLKLGAAAPVAAAPPAVAAPAEQPVPRPTVKKPAAQRIVVQSAAGQSLRESWDEYFAQQAESLAAVESADAAQAEVNLLASLRETVRQLMREKKYGETALAVQAALRHGLVEPWMYEAIALAMQADGAPQEELERVLMSGVDFAENPDRVLIVAAYMSQAGLHRRALALYRQIGTADPSRPEPFIQGLAMAQRLDDIEAIQWACVGLLAQAWPAEHRTIGEHAYRVGKATYERLLAAGRKAEADAFDAAVRKAAARDCVVVVTWTGDADIDLVVEEPAGTVVSPRQPRSTSGGVHLGDVSSADGKSTADGFREVYVCPQGFAGEYRVMLKNVWGRPTGGKVNLDVYSHYGTKDQAEIHEVISLSEKTAVAAFELKEGRRAEPLPEAQVAQVATVQTLANRAILAQQLAAVDNSSVAQSFASSLAAANALGLGPGFFRRGAVGYRPQLTTLPEGANFSTNAVISADRRYVRVSPAPTFSQITDVSTFNFVTGQGQQQGGGGGGGGFGGGIGSGGFF